MQERLIVKNFGPIKAVDLDLSQTTIFIGEQASGKSTLAKLIAIFRSLQKLDNLENDFYSKFKDYIIQDFLIENTYFEYKNDATHLIFANNEFQKIVFNAQNFDTNSSLYIPVERILIPVIAQSLFRFINSEIGLSKMVIGFGSKFEQARQNIKNYFIDFLNLNYQYLEGKDIINENGYKLALSNASSGLQAIIPMLLVIENSNNRIFSHFIIEEPELNLYPTTQHNLTKFIAAKCTAENQQLTITTHSPYLLSSLNILLFAHQAGQIDAAETSKIIPKESWINPQNFNAYFLEKSGTARPIFDKKTGMISENELDNVSLDLGDEFDSLMDIYQSVPA